MKAWITKHCLTQGIQEMEVDMCNTSGSMVRVKTVDRGQWRGGYTYFHGEGRDWHRTRESAVKRANAQRDRKISQLEEQIKRLKAIQF